MQADPSVMHKKMGMEGRRHALALLAHLKDFTHTLGHLAGKIPVLPE